MKKIKGSLLLKTLAAILFCALMLGFAFSALGLGMLYSAGWYSRGTEAARETLAKNLCHNETWLIAEAVLPLNDLGENNIILADSANYRYEVYDDSGELRFSNYEGEETLCSVTVPNREWYPYYEFPQGQLWGEESEEASRQVAEKVAEEAAEEATPIPTETAEVTPTPSPLEEPQVIATPGDIYEPRGREVSFTVVCYLLRDLTARDNAAFQLRGFDFAVSHSRDLVIAAVGSLLLAIALFIFLMSAAGHRKDTDEIRPRFVEKIPFDLFTAAIALAAGAALYVCIETLDSMARAYNGIELTLAAAALLLTLAVLLALWWCMSMAVRVKLGTLVKGTLCYKLVRFLAKILKALWGWGKMLLGGIPLIWRGLLILCGAEFIGFLILAANDRIAGAVGFLINIFVFFPLAIWGLVSAKKLRLGASEIAAGNTAYRIDTKYLLGEFRRHAEDLNAIQGGISRAVDEKLRSERMKTELITNVSHDIKTPLTSIVNYVDLLSKEEIEGEKAWEYLEVLQRQSARLKKLTDDLVEASKASSGALGVTIEDCELGVMLEQTAGEYGEKLAEKGLTLVLRKPDKTVTVKADARHTQRIFDNLMSNILKYALPGTRVYLELAEDEKGAAVIFRNTSGREIVLSAEELTERFVRGDAARSTEGSGLGLSIARSLAELQGGSLSVTVDGDLFKVVLGFAR